MTTKTKKYIQRPWFWFNTLLMLNTRSHPKSSFRRLGFHLFHFWLGFRRLFWKYEPSYNIRPFLLGRKLQMLLCYLQGKSTYLSFHLHLITTAISTWTVLSNWKHFIHLTFYVDDNRYFIKISKCSNHFKFTLASVIVKALFLK